MWARRLIGGTLVAVLAACSPAPSATPAAPSSATPSAAPSAEPTPSGPAFTAFPTATPIVPEPSPSADPAYMGSFEVLPASPTWTFHAKIACSGKIGASDPVALVTMAEAGDAQNPVVLRDYADPKNPRTVCTFDNVRVERLIDPRHVVVADDDGYRLYAVVDLPEVRYRWFQLPRGEGEWGAELITVGLDRIVWKDVHARDTDTDVVYVSTAARTLEVATLPDTNEGRCGEPADSTQGAFTTDGSYLYVLSQPILANHSLLVVKGRETLLSVVPPHVEWAAGNEPVMALWSPVSPTLYWSQGGDAWKWTPDGGRQRFLDGVAWSDASISADGRFLAYSVLRSDGKEVVYLLDLTAGGVPQRIGDGPRGHPRFLNATQLFWRPPAAGAGCTGPVRAPRIFDVTNGKEAGSIVDSVQGTWPATSAKQYS